MKKAGCLSLGTRRWTWLSAGTVFEIFLHRLAAGNNLILHVSEYVVKPRNKRRILDTWKVNLKNGRAYPSRTATSTNSTPLPEDLQSELKGWRDNDEFSYWFPLCDNFPNIDSIVKLEPSSSRLGGGVAYLQITTATTHKIDGEQLKNLGGIFKRGGVDPPIYIAVCSDRRTAEDLSLTTQEAVREARNACKVHVGFYEEAALQTIADEQQKRASDSDAPLPRKRTRKNADGSRTGVRDVDGQLAIAKVTRAISSHNLRLTPKQTKRTQY